MQKILKDSNVRPYVSFACLYPKGYVLYKEMEKCTRIGIVLEGNIKMIHYTRDGKEIVLGELKENDFFGDFLVFSSTPYYPGNMVIEEDAKIVYVEKANIDSLLVHSKVFRTHFLKNISEKAVKLNYHNKLLNLDSMEDKIIFYLEKESSQLKTNKVLVKNKTTLAKFLNVQRPSLSRELKRLKAAKILDFDRDYIWLLNNDARV